VGTEQDGGAVKAGKFVVLDGDKSAVTEALDLLTVVDDVAEAIEATGPTQVVFGLGDGADYAGAEAGFFVDVDGHCSMA
jgi:hypothetical protein